MKLTGLFFRSSKTIKKKIRIKKERFLSEANLNILLMSKVIKVFVRREKYSSSYFL